RAGRWKSTFGMRKHSWVSARPKCATPNPWPRAPAFLVAAYSMLLWTNIRVFGERRTQDFDRLPAWRNTEPMRPSTRDLLRLLQRQAEEANLNQMRN
ncbi:MAG: hypothetical protein NT154_25535, partial [Verrucomicrobia bacterium]|nr:hypothetical protein [Verrucomicrobiota bacterium]